MRRLNKVKTICGPSTLKRRKVILENNSEKQNNNDLLSYSSGTFIEKSPGVEIQMFNIQAPDAVETGALQIKQSNKSASVLSTVIEKSLASK